MRQYKVYTSTNQSVIMDDLKEALAKYEEEKANGLAAWVEIGSDVRLLLSLDGFRTVKIIKRAEMVESTTETSPAGFCGKWSEWVDETEV